MSTFTQAVLLGLLGAYCHIDWSVGSLYLNRPIVLAPLVGLIFGYLQAGLLLGATLDNSGGDKRAVVALADTETGEVFKTSFIRQIEVDEEQFTKIGRASCRERV